jgi:hypothetical protein
MGKKIVINVGDRYGKLVITEYLGIFNKAKKVICKCDCGNYVTRYFSSLISKGSESCGCILTKNHFQIGGRYGKLIIIEEVDNIKVGKRTHRLIKCKCDCGNEKIVRLTNLTSNNSKSCGCLQNKIPPIERHYTHYMSDTIEYNSWKAMKRRCYDLKHRSYKDYGGRGIIVCDRWLEPDGKGCINFITDLGLRPSNKHTLDRINVNGIYEPSNCRWATHKEQSNNKRYNLKV